MTNEQGEKRWRTDYLDGSDGLGPETWLVFLDTQDNYAVAMAAAIKANNGEYRVHAVPLFPLYAEEDAVWAEAYLNSLEARLADALADAEELAKALERLVKSHALGAVNANRQFNFKEFTAAYKKAEALTKHRERSRP